MIIVNKITFKIHTRMNHRLNVAISGHNEDVSNVIKINTTQINEMNFTVNVACTKSY